MGRITHEVVRPHVRSMRIYSVALVGDDSDTAGTDSRPEAFVICAPLNLSLNCVLSDLG